MLMCKMNNSSIHCEDTGCNNQNGSRSRSVQGLTCTISSPAMKIPLPPRLWLTDVEDESSDDECSIIREDGAMPVERTRVRSRFRHHKQRSVNMPVGIFWDIENCQVPRGCSAIDVVAAIRAKFLTGRREVDFVVVCDVRKEAPHRLQELNDAQISLIHVCGTQKNAADEKLRQCMRRFGELHTAPAALLLISGDINFAADLSDFRHRKNMEVILVHKQNTSTALITCASSHYCYNELTAQLPRNPKISQTEDDGEATCEMEVLNLPVDQPPERISRRLRRLADNCGGKVLKVNLSTATIRFPTPDHAARALKRMDGEDVFGRKISTRYARGTPFQAAYSSDEGYSTAPANQPPPRPAPQPPVQTPTQVLPASLPAAGAGAASEWALALQQLPAPTPPPLDFCPPPAPRPRKIRGTHGSASLDLSGCSSSNSGDDRREAGPSRAASPWNSSASFSEQSDDGDVPGADLTVSNLPPFDPNKLQEMLTKLFSQYVPVVRVSIWSAGEGPCANVALRSEHDARLAIARVHKRRLDSQWAGRRLELSLGRPSPAPNLDVLRARLRAILLDQKDHMLPLLRLRDAYASRHCCALTASDLARVKDTVITHEGFGRVVQLIDLTPVSNAEMEEAPWRCSMHSGPNVGHEDGSCILSPVFMQISVLARHVEGLLQSHGGVLPLLSFVECYEASFPPLGVDVARGVPLELLLRSIPTVELRDSPSRHLAWRTEPAAQNTSTSDSFRSGGDRERPRTAPSLEPMLALFERELQDLLRTYPHCSIPFSKLIPAFHHHFGRQCRVADYGFTKLPDLLAALGNTIEVLGSGSYRVITISAAAQGRRWTSDLIKVLKAHPGRAVHLQDIPQLFQAALDRTFNPVDYGVCTIEELMERVTPGTIIVSRDWKISLPRHEPTPEERARTLEFAMQAVELLRCTPNLRMEFSRFVPAYQAHFGRQLRVAHYGCVKLVELFDLIPEAVSVCCESWAERSVRLTTKVARAILAQRVRAIVPVELAAFSASYNHHFGAPPLPDMLDVSTVLELFHEVGAYVENGVVYAAGDTPRLVNAALAACAVLTADRSVARGSTEEYFVSGFRNQCNVEPNLRELISFGVVEMSDNRVRASTAWRAVWRVAQILADSMGALTAMEIFNEYTKRYGSSFANGDMGMASLQDTLGRHMAVFSKVSGGAEWRWALCAGVKVPPRRDAVPLRCALEDYSVFDTPPGQKGSRVFESPKTNIWCSPPASDLPAPTALLSQEKRRTRLAAQFDAV